MNFNLKPKERALLIAFAAVAKTIEFSINKYGRQTAEDMILEYITICSPANEQLFLTAFGK